MPQRCSLSTTNIDETSIVGQTFNKCISLYEGGADIASHLEIVQRRTLDLRNES